MDATYRLRMFKAKAKELEKIFANNTALGRMVRKQKSENDDE